MAMKMKAALCAEFGEPLIIEEISIDEPRQDEIRIKVSACGICHSDVLYIDGGWGGDLPNLFGHEASGVVESCGPGVTHVKPGDSVSVSLLRSCGHCFYCQRQQWSQCEYHFATDEPNRLQLSDGTSVRRGLGTGCFAQYAVVHKSQVVNIPKDMNMASASLLTCGVITGFGSVVNTAAIRGGEHVVVIGTGGVGINCIQGARIGSAATIIAVDINEDKLAFAKQLGATHLVNSSHADVREAVLDVTERRGADAVFVATGHPAALEGVFGFLRPGGQLIMVGMPANDVHFSFETVEFIDANQSILGSKMGGSNLKTDIANLIEHYQAGALELDALVSTTYPLDDINSAINATRKGNGIRNVVVM